MIRSYDRVEMTVPVQDEVPNISSSSRAWCTLSIAKYNLSIANYKIYIAKYKIQLNKRRNYIAKYKCTLSIAKYKSTGARRPHHRRRAWCNSR